MRIKIAALAACVVAMLVPAVASADFRTDNTWMAATPRLERTIRQVQWFRGPETGWANKTVRYVRCLGDNSGDYSIDRAHGFYHHFWFCLALLNNTNYEASFQVWQIGPNDRNYRVTDIKLFHT